MITSRQNPKIKEARALRSRKGRDDAGMFLVEGIRPVGVAVEAGAILEGLYYAPEKLESGYAWQLIQSQENAGIPCYSVSSDVFDSMADKDNPQGLLAVIHTPSYALEALNPDNFGWGVALLAPQDPGNIGTILRTIDAVGADGLLLLNDPETNQFSAEVVHPSAVRASMGTIFWLPVVSATFTEFSSWIEKNHYAVYGTSAHASQDYRSIASYSRPAILLLGSEQKGLSEKQISICTQLIQLPMHGRATSLNLAVAAGVFLYQMAETSPSRRPD